MVKLVKRTVSLMLVLLLLAGCAAAEEPANDPSVITVAAFPYLTDVDKFKELAADMWAEIDPETELVFVDWDCYGPELPTADVFMYDALFTDWLRHNDVLLPLAETDVDRADDILPFVWEGVHDEGMLYGIPNLTCAYHLIYYQDDHEVAAADNMMDLYDVVCPRTTDDLQPADRSEGLFFATGETPFFYVEGLVDATSDPEVLMDLTNLSDPDALNSVIYMVEMAGAQLMEPPVKPEVLFDWFNSGYGRVYLGYSEALVNFDDIIDQLDIKLFSFSHQDNVPLYFVDMVSINSAVQNPQKADKCKKLLNLLSSEAFIHSLLLNGEEELQFMMPARLSVWQTLRQLHPLYEKLYGFITQEGNIVTRYGITVHEYLTNAYAQLPTLMMNQY